MTSNGYRVSLGGSDEKVPKVIVKNTPKTIEMHTLMSTL